MAGNNFKNFLFCHFSKWILCWKHCNLQNCKKSSKWQKLHSFFPYFVGKHTHNRKIFRLDSSLSWRLKLYYLSSDRQFFSRVGQNSLGSGQNSGRVLTRPIPNTHIYVLCMRRPLWYVAYSLVYLHYYEAINLSKNSKVLDFKGENDHWTCLV